MLPVQYVPYLPDATGGEAEQVQHHTRACSQFPDLINSRSLQLTACPYASPPAKRCLLAGLAIRLPCEQGHGENTERSHQLKTYSAL